MVGGRPENVNTMKWNELTFDEIGALDRDLPVVVPLGSCEQHGHHLPLAVDTVQVSELARRLEASLGDRALFVDALWLGCSHHHLDYPGTISVGPMLYAQVIADVARSILRAGFRRIFFMNGHGGNELPGRTGLTDLVVSDERADAATIAFASWWSVGRDALSPTAHGLTQPEITHACEIETSLMLAIRPDLVDLPKVRASSPRFSAEAWHSERGGKVEVFHRFQRLTTHGHMGRPELATAEKGVSMLEALVAEIGGFLLDFAGWPHLEAASPGGGDRG